MITKTKRISNGVKLNYIETDKFKTIFYKDFFLPIIHNISNDTFFGGYYYVKIRFCDD